MDNKQLFEQSASKILSKNQLEGVMRLHNAIFECGQETLVADTVANAVVDAVKDSVEEVADKQVEDAIENTPSIEVVPADKVRLEALIDSMNDSEKQMFLESLDDQQVEVLMEGFGSLAKRFLNMFTKQGRLTNRLDKYGRLASKDAEMTNKLDNLMGIDPYNLSPKNTKKFQQLVNDRAATQRQMNDMRFKAGNRPGDEVKRMDEIALSNGSRNVKPEVIENRINELAKEQEQKLARAKTNFDKKIQTIDKDRDEALQQLSKQRNAELNRIEMTKNTFASEAEYKQAIAEVNQKFDNATKSALDKHKANYDKAVKSFNTSSSKVKNTFDTKIKDYENRLNMVQEEAGLGGMTRGVGRRGRYNMPRNGFPYGQPFYGAPYMNPAAWGQFTEKFSTMRKVARGLVGSYKAFMGVLKLGALGALGVGAVKLYNIFAHPEEIDAAGNGGSIAGALGGGDGEEGSTMDTVKKVIAVLGGGVAGNVAARFLGFDSTTGKTVGTLLGAILVAYFMFLNGGDEQNAVEMLDEYNNASEQDKQVINEALDMPGLADALQKLYDENH